VGFSGRIVFGRSDRSLLESSAFDRVRPLWDDGADAWWPRPGGWQTLQFTDDKWGSEELRALVASSGAPACVATVYDSDVAEVLGLTPDGRTWEAALNLEMAAAMGARRPGHVHDDLVWVESPEYAQAVTDRLTRFEAAVPGNAEAAIAWAGAAGVATAADEVALRALLQSREVFVEDLFAGLLDTLGFPPAVDPAGESGA
jgi:hypothetical protein